MREQANRRTGQQAIRTLGCLLFALAATGALTAQDLSSVALAKEDWPQILGPNRNGIYTGPPIVPSFPRSGPPSLWTREVGAGFSGPAVAGERLVLFHRVNNRETVEAIDALTGKTAWMFDYPTAYRDDFGFDEGPRAVPVIAGGRVFTHGADGMLHGLDFATGKMLWSSDTRRVFDAPKGYFGVASSPVVDGNRVLVNVGGRKGLGPPKPGEGGGIVAFDAATGKTLWTSTADEPSYSAPVIATINGQHTGVFFTRTGLVAIDPASGKVLYQFRWRARMAASVNAAVPIVRGNQIFLSASYGTGAVLLQVANNSVTQVWSGDESMSNHYSTSVLKDGYLYGFDGRQEFGQSLRCVELATGKVMWNVDGFGAGSLLIAGETLVIMRESGELALAPASPKAFRFSARAQLLKGVVRAYPALAGGRFFVRNDRQLGAYDLRVQ
ncbi:MAG TPA: PQQ-binding-like beta-propeller repeat protein [Vicinamibacterales bacterium]|nr:PQQ-binding-like beta-propeller repeat protein [Vicinamibacterales bacterium]